MKRCKECNRQFKTQQALWGHMKAHSPLLKGRARDKAYSEAKEAPEKALRGPSKAPSGPESQGPPMPREPKAPPERVGPEEPAKAMAYPSLSTWKATEKDEKAAVGAESAEVPSGTAPAAKPSTVPAAFTTDALWQSLGDFIDSTVLKDKSMKVNMDSRKARVLNDSLANMGLVTEAPTAPIVVPNWAPLAVSVFATFGLPVILALGPGLLKKPTQEDVGKGIREVNEKLKEEGT